MKFTEKMLNESNGKHAVVIGGSMAGMLAARVLSEHFEQVTIVERDPAPHAEARKGVPQGNHLHLLLRSGGIIIEQLFPGLTEELQASGTTLVDFGADTCWFHRGQWKLRYESNFPVLLQSRPFLESHIRRRLASYANVTFRYGTSVTNLCANADHSRVTGLQIQGQEELEELSADLVVDASGRGSKMPRWLSALNYPPPAESKVKIRLGYSSRFYQRVKREWLGLMFFPNAPQETRAGYMFPVEGDRWIVTLIGYMGDYPPHDEDGFLAFARGLPRQDIYNEIKDAKPLSDIKTSRCLAQIRRHYEKLKHFPDGLIVLGDAACHFDPVYGQGMSVAAKEAQALDDCLRAEAKRGNGEHLVGFPMRFHKSISKVIDAPWLLTTVEAFRYPQAEGNRPFGTTFLQWYTAKVLDLSSTDKDVYGPFLQVAHLLKDPLLFFHPSILLRVLKHSLGFNKRSPALIDSRPVRPPFDKLRNQVKKSGHPMTVGPV